jgi:peroxiredoxin
MSLSEGDTAPDFELRDQDGDIVRLSGLRGRRAVLYRRGELPDE